MELLGGGAAVQWYLTARVGTRNKGTGHGHRAMRWPPHGHQIHVGLTSGGPRECRRQGASRRRAQNPRSGHPAGDDERDGQKS